MLYFWLPAMNIFTEVMQAAHLQMEWSFTWSPNLCRIIFCSLMLVYFLVCYNLLCHTDLFRNGYWLYLPVADVINQIFLLGEKKMWDRPHMCLDLYRFTKDSDAVILVTWGRLMKAGLTLRTWSTHCRFEINCPFASSNWLWSLSMLKFNYL